MEQGAAEQALQTADLSAECGLWQSEFCRRFVEAARGRYGTEIAQMAKLQLHGHEDMPRES
ncbi:hypothetical protein GCM10023324_28680 [Streptomyces youssoufiensis]